MSLTPHDGQQITLYPGEEVSTVERRSDNGWNLHKESGSTVWNISEADLVRLIEYERVQKERRAYQEYCKRERAFLEREALHEQALKENAKFDRKRRKELRANGTASGSQPDTNPAA